MSDRDTPRPERTLPTEPGDWRVRVAGGRPNIVAAYLMEAGIYPYRAACPAPEPDPSCQECGGDVPGPLSDGRCSDCASRRPAPAQRWRCEGCGWDVGEANVRRVVDVQTGDVERVHAKGGVPYWCGPVVPVEAG